MIYARIQLFILYIQTRGRLRSTYSCRHQHLQELTEAADEAKIDGVKDGKEPLYPWCLLAPDSAVVACAEGKEKPMFQEGLSFSYYMYTVYRTYHTVCISRKNRCEYKFRGWLEKCGQRCLVR